MNRSTRQLAALLAAFFVCSCLEAADFHPISNVTTSTSNDLYPVSNLIQGAGLGYANAEPHAQLGGGSSHLWVTDAPGGFPSDFIALEGKPVLVFDLGQERALSEISVWGYATSNANGVSRFTLRFATAAEGLANFGASIPYSPTFEPSIDDEVRQSFPFTQVVVARYVEFTCDDNFYANGGQGPPGGGDRVGLGEVAFEDSVPNPNPVISVSASALDYGNPAANPGPATQTLTISNLGSDQPLQVTTAGIAPGPGSTGFFSVSGASFPLTIPAGGSTDLSIGFDSMGVEGCFNAVLEFVSNDPAAELVSVLLTAGVNCVPSELDAPVFSIPSGTFTGSFELELTTSTPGAQIFYTTDGSLPSTVNGTLYQGPITISSSTQIRAATVSGASLPAVATESYVRLAADVQNYASALPILVVENFGAGTIPNKGWSTSTQTGAGLVQPHRQSAAMLIMDRDPGTNSSAISAPADLDSRIGIRVRGAFSSTWNPKPYSVEAWKKDADEDRNIKPLGLPNESDWFLYYLHPSYDRTMLYNTFIWELSPQTGRYGTRFQFVDVFVNENGGDLQLSDRRGVYAFAEKVKRGGDRIDFEALSEDGTTGGWLLGINRMDPEPADGFPAENGATSPQFFHTAGPNRVLQTPANSAGQGDDIPRQSNAYINFESPNGYKINTAQRDAIEDWFREFEDVFYDDALWRDPVNGYRKYLDTRDFIDYFHLLNLAKQGDGLLISMFPWVSSGERKLHMGPMWDFNNGAYGSTTNSPLYFRSDRLWYPRLFADPDYLREYIDRWYELRRGPLADTNMDAIIDRQSGEITEGLAAAQGLSASTWNSRLNTMKNNLSNRAAWLDSQFFEPPAFNSQGGIVGPGFSLTMANSTGTAGTVYYTADGSDPIPPSEVNAVDTLLLDEGASASALIPSVTNGGAALTTAQWTALADPPNSETWIEGTSGVGYDYDGLTGLDVSDMVNANSSVFVRVQFTIPDQESLDSWSSLTLRMKYDDGFVAWINGVKVTDSQAPANPAWNSLATSSHFDNDAIVFVDFDISEHLDLLQPGENMLAIQGLNATLGSSDLLILPQLVATEIPGSTAQVYTGPILLTESATIRARVQATSNGEWSAYNEATFIVGTPADASNLVISEIMYHPADPEAGAEFIEVQNISDTLAIDLTGVEFTAGIHHAFPAGAALEPGERLFITEAEFENSTRLANSGEQIVLTGADGLIIRDFEYNDKTPWPEAADGEGFSLVLVDPLSNPDHGDPASWRRSSAAGGNPGGTDAVSFGGGDPSADEDRDGLSALLEYAFGTSDEDPREAAGAISLAIAPDGTPQIEFPRNSGAEDVALSLETSIDLETWSAAQNAEFFGVTFDSQGKTLEQWRIPLDSAAAHSFIRVRGTQR